jgi:hypothetical protein
MTRYLPVIAMTLLVSSALAPTVRAGKTGYATSYPPYRGKSSCADSKFSTPRDNQLLPYRHQEDRRRYNAAPCHGEVVRSEPYLLKTVIISKKRVPHYTFDSAGNRRCHRVVTITYKNLYSDGSCYVWTETA